MLNDPLILAVMRSDGVTAHEHATLWFRVKDTLAERDPARTPAREMAHA
jgi:hypothetical protein